MVKKKFFRDNGVKEIERLNCKRVYHNCNLIERLDDIDPSQDALILQARLLHNKFYTGRKTGAQASAKAYRHGDCFALKHPTTREDCWNSSDTPVIMRESAVVELSKMKEQDIPFLGFSMQATWSDRTKRRILAVNSADGQRIDCYASNMLPYVDGEGRQRWGIEVKPYADAARVRQDGAFVIATVPSREEKKSGYTSGLAHVPVERSQYNLATVLMLKPMGISLIDEDEERGLTEHELYTQVKYPWQTERRRGEEITFSAQDVARYIATVRFYYGMNRWSPLEMNPFIFFSKKGAEIDNKIRNNVLIYDPSLSENTHPEKLRKPHLAERSLILMRAIPHFSNYEFAFWDPARDGKLKDYNWSIPGTKSEVVGDGG